VCGSLAAKKSDNVNDAVCYPYLPVGDYLKARTSVRSSNILVRIPGLADFF
jgi:hypothetical protein